MHETTVDGWHQWRTNDTRWSTKKQLLMDETDEGIHAWWCTKLLLMDETNERLPIPDDVQNNCWWMRQMEESILDGVRNNWWWMRPMKDYPYQMMYKNNCWWMRQMKESIPDDVRNNWWWMRPMKDYPYQTMYKTTVDGWERWRNSYQMVHETTVDGWNQWRTTDTRRCTKQLLMDKREEGIHTR